MDCRTEFEGGQGGGASVSTTYDGVVGRERE